DTSHVEDAKQKKNQRADNYTFDDGKAAGSLKGSTRGEHQRDSHNENEKREDQVIKMKSGPFAMFHLGGKKPGQPRVVDPGQRSKHQVSTHDPEHITPAESIERDEARGRPRVSL